MLRKQGNHCWFAFVLWCGYRSLSFQSFVLRHLLITKKLPFFLRATRECPVTRLHRGKNMVKNGVKRQTNNNKKNFGEQREPSCRLRRTRARLASLADFFRLFLNCGTWSQANRCYYTCAVRFPKRFFFTLRSPSTQTTLFLSLHI